MARIHFIGAEKDGGKSLIDSLLAQYAIVHEYPYHPYQALP